MISVRTIDVGPADLLLDVFDDVASRDRLIEDVGEAARQRWIMAANEKLGTTRRDYVNAIGRLERVGGGRVEIALMGNMPNNVEHGMDAFDMHDTLLDPSDPLVHEMEDEEGNPAGYYRNVSFRHKGADTGFGGIGTPAGRQFVFDLGFKNAKKLGRQIMREAKRLAPGARLREGRRETEVPMLTPVRNRPNLGSPHKTDIFAGLTKVTGGGKQTRYMTWRRIATGSPGWLHPGIKPYRLLDDVIKDIDEIVTRLVDGRIQGMLSVREAPK